MENTLDIWSKKGRMPKKTNLPKRAKIFQPIPPRNAVSNPRGNRGNMPFKRLPKAEYDSRREKGLCFNYNEKYTYEYKCARLFQITLAPENGGDSFLDDDDGEF